MLDRRRLSDRRLATLFLLVLASGLCVALAAARVMLSGSARYDFLVWNLVLAWIPFLVGIAVYDGHRRGASPVVLGGLSLVWLVFFPNAPYILTDFIHLKASPAAPLWFDGLMLAAFAGTGLLLGFASLYLVQVVVRGRLGARAGWLLVFSVLTLGSFGVLVGRLGRFNSWDVVARPAHLASRIAEHAANPLAHLGALALMVTLAGLLSFAYLLLYSLVQAGIDLERPSRLQARRSEIE